MTRSIEQLHDLIASNPPGSAIQVSTDELELLRMHPFPSGRAIRPTPPTCVTCKWVQVREHRGKVTRVNPETGNVDMVDGVTYTEHNCSRDVPQYNPVTGQTWNLNAIPRACDYMRKFRGGDRRNNDAWSGGDCGPEGKLWEAKDPE